MINKNKAFGQIVDKIFAAWAAYGMAYGTSESATVNTLDRKIRDLYHATAFMDR